MDDGSKFWQGKRVWLTGHTGFKGSWLALWLTELGAKVHGLALEPDTNPSLFELLKIEDRIYHHIGDIRDEALVAKHCKEASPDIVFHMAAKPLVLESYQDPLGTFATNVMGSAHVLNALREHNQRCACVMVTTDKVYENHEWEHAYRETDRLGGHDPYSASKAAMEIMLNSFRASFFDGDKVRIASARAGNVIAGGDWAENRIVPDIVRSLALKNTINVRNANATRPWQHVLEPLSGYMRLAEKLFTTDDPRYRRAFNFGPDSKNFRTVKELTEQALATWSGTWEDGSDPSAPHEASNLSLTIERARRELAWQPRWDFDITVARSIGWYKKVYTGSDAVACALDDIAAYGVP